MDLNLTILQLESAINRCKLAEPVSNYILPGDLRVLASLYGEMIFHRLDSIQLASQSELLQTVLMKWAIPKDSVIEPQPEKSCSFSPGNAGFEDCEACQ